MTEYPEPPVAGNEEPQIDPQTGVPVLPAKEADVEFTAAVLPDLKDALAKINPAEDSREKTMLTGAVADMAWYSIYFDNTPDVTAAMLDALSKLVPADNVTLVRLTCKEDRGLSHESFTVRRNQRSGSGSSAMGRDVDNPQPFFRPFAEYAIDSRSGSRRHFQWQSSSFRRNQSLSRSGDFGPGGGGAASGSKNESRAFHLITLRRYGTCNLNREVFGIHELSGSHDK
jgi:hypothetical protein